MKTNRVVLFGLALCVWVTLAWGGHLAANTSDAGEVGRLSMARPQPAESVLSAENSFSLLADNSSQTLYCFPEDSGDTTTVFLSANTNNTRVEVSAWAYRANGTVTSSLTYFINPGQMIAVYSDDAANVHDGAFVWDLGLQTAYVEFLLPSGVALDGHIAWSSNIPYDELSVPDRIMPLQFVRATAQ